MPAELTTATTTAALREEVEAFVLREALLADESRYEDWEALWTDDGVYWVPLSDEDYDPTERTSIIHDDRTRIAQRVERLTTGDAHVQYPPSRLRRLVSNFEVETEGDEIVVRCNFICVEVRNATNIWAGRTDYRLRREGDELRMAHKKVLLVNHDRELPALGFLI